MTAKEKAVAQLLRIIESIKPITDEMRSVVFYLHVALNYIELIEDGDDYIEGKRAAYNEVIALFNSLQEPNSVPGMIKTLIEDLPK